MVYIVLGNGFEETEAIAPIDCLRRAGVEVVSLGINGEILTGANGIPVKADRLLSSLTEEEMAAAELVILPGGWDGVMNIKASAAAKKLVSITAAAGKPIAAICAAPTVFGEMGLLKGKKAVCYPSLEEGLTGADVQYGTGVVVDGKVITSEAAGSAIEFGLKLCEILRGREAAEAVCESIHYHHAF